jgi:hypothetical protein
VLPGPADDVIIDVMGDMTVVHSTGDDVINSLVCAEAITLTFGSIDIAMSSTIATYSQSGGTLQGSGDLTVTGLMTWTAGTITGTGTLFADGGLDVSGASLKLLSRNLENSDAATWSGTGQLRISDAAVFTNLPGAVFEAQTGTLLLRDSNYLQTDGETHVEATLEVVTNIFDLQGGVLSGNGLVIADVLNAGIVAPGSSAGELTIQGTYTQTSVGTLRTELGGTDPGQFDVLTIDGDAFLGGLLTIPLINGFFPETGQQFTILTTTGTRNDEFDLVDCPGIYEVVYLPAAARLDVLQGQLPGDINCDGSVNITDLLLVLGFWT